MDGRRVSYQNPTSPEKENTLRAELQKKAWGHVRHAFDSPSCAVSILHTESGGFCSRHLHRERVNRFVVISGILEVVTYTADASEELSRTRLDPGSLHDVPAGVVHSFEVVLPGIVVEVYWPSATVRLDDIERITLGGKRDGH